MFRNGKLKAATTVTVLACFGWMTCGGNSWAESRNAQRDPAGLLRRLADDPRLALSKEERDYLRRAAQQIETHPPAKPVRVPAAPIETSAAARMREVAVSLGELAGPAGKPTPSAVADVRLRLQKTHEQVLAELADSEARLRAAGLPRVILDRNEAARADYLKNVQPVFDKLDAAARARDPREERAAIAAAADLLKGTTIERPRQPFDPTQLPFRSPKPTTRKPATAPAARAGQDGQRLLTAAMAPPTPADLAANEDAQITPEIQALAASLGNRPLKIYEWVRNNVEYVPTYGSVQGSRMTLIAKRGNAFDIASLLIALLRAANVPARYVTGTMEVPIDAAMSWLGGVASPSMAQQLLGQGGVPNVGLLSGGTITHIRIDHVWVEALVDYIPSRGTVQREGDTWVPMDASFKLHDLRPASGLFTDNPMSVLLQPGDHLFDFDESLGKFSNVRDGVLDDRVTDWVTRSEDYIRTHGVEKSVLGLLGGPAIVGESSAAFAGSLPYEVVTRGAAVSTLPASLRHTVSLKGYASEFDRALGSPAFSIDLSLPALNSRRLGIQFEPATQADADTLAAARNGSGTTLPVYLINVVPVVKLDGAELGRGGSVRMGSFYSVDVVLRGPEGPTTVPYRVVAGDEIVVGVTGNGVHPDVVAERFASHPVDNAPEYLHEVALNYWAECDYLGEIAARPLGVRMLRLPSVGFFSSPMTVSYLFGAPMSAVYKTRIMDVKLSFLGAAGGDHAKVVAFMKQAGVQGSYLEGAVFDQLENRPASKGISAIHLIGDAVGQDIPVYRITSANSAAVLPLLQVSSAVKSDIQSAVSHGKTVIVPESDIDTGPWSGVGYIVQDESTGAGAYLISGGADGGGLADCDPVKVPVWVWVLVLVLLLILLMILLIMMAGGLAPVLAAAGAAGASAAEAFAAFLLFLRGLAALTPAY